MEAAAAAAAVSAVSSAAPASAASSGAGYDGDDGVVYSDGFQGLDEENDRATALRRSKSCAIQ